MPPPGRGLGPRGFLTDEEKKNLPKVDKALLLRILSYLRPYWPQFLLVFLTILLSAILGLLPASLATGIGSDVQRPLATVIVYGLLFSTIITLYILPTLYYLMERRHEDKNVKSDEEYL